MIGEYEIEDFISKLFKSALIGVFIGYFVKKLKEMNVNKSENDEMTLRNKKETRLILKKFHKYTRDEIIAIGKQAIRCALTNKIFIEPVVSINGKSYEKKAIIEFIEKNKMLPSGEINLDIKLYDNRALREFLEKCNEIYKFTKHI